VDATLAAIVLAGGHSSRMGTDKALLDWHGSTMLRRITGILQRLAEPVVVVTALGQRLPSLPGVDQAADRAPERGPLEGIAAGIRALDDRCELVFVGAVDAPFLHPAFVSGLVSALGNHDAAVPDAGGHRHPTAAVYRTSLLPVLERVLDAGQRAPADLFSRIEVRLVEESELSHPESLVNVNTPDQYRAALDRPPPLVEVRRAGKPQAPVRAATLGAALAAVRPGRVRLNGRPVAPEGDLPLVDGDVIAID
jgi:molybdenum cofactor guanylyltransferase